MDLIIGGACQGKLSYVYNCYGFAQEEVFFGGSKEEMPASTKKALDQMHLLVRSYMESGKEPESELERILAENPEIVIICNEVGYGIVPVEHFEREYRERVGRLCCMLVGRAERVVRVVCGIGTVIKGEPI